MDTGLGFVQPMFFVGVVEDRNDPRFEGRVRVRAFGVHGSNRDIPTEELPWATLILGHHDVNFTIPPLNAWVFGFFIDGRDAQQPMILGLIPAQSVEAVNPAEVGWGAQPAENYDLQMQGARARDIGTSPMPNLATGEFLNETYNAALEVNRAREIPIAGGGARGYTPGGNGNAWTDDRNEGQDAQQDRVRPTETLPPLTGNQNLEDSRRLAESYIGRSISDSDWDLLVRATFAEATPNPAEQAAVMSVILNRVISPSYPNSIREVLYQRNQFQAVTGTRQQPGPSGPFRANRSQAQLGSLANALNSYLPVYSSRGWLNFTSNITAAYGPGTNIGFRTTVRNAPNSEVIGGTVFGTVSGISPRGPVQPFMSEDGLSSQEELTVDPGLAAAARAEQSRLEEQRQSRAAALRAELNTIESDIAALENLPEFETKVRELRVRKAEIERELAELDPTATTGSQAGESYRGYGDSYATNTVATWDEPASAYAAQYPFNRVIETAAGHSIELDDTPGGERIMIWHRSGSYIQISSTATTHKNMGDSYNIHERNHHVYIKGTNIITIDGDSHVLVKGNKVEEIQGDYRQIVHGSIQVGAARSVEINGATRTDIRSAALALDSNVENLNIRTSQTIAFESGDSISFRSKNIAMSASENASITGQGVFFESDQNMHMKANGNMFVNPSQNLYLRAGGGTISMQTAGSIRMNSGAFTSIKSGSTMDIDSGSNLAIRSGATINMNSDGLISLKSTEMFLDSGGGKMNVTGENVAIEASGAVDIKGSGGPVSVEANGAMNLLSSVQMRITGSDVYIRGGKTYIDDEVELASGVNNPAAPADSADVKEAIEPAAYAGEFDSGDISPEADSAPPAPAAETAESPAAGSPAPPTESIPENELLNLLVTDQDRNFA